MTLPGVDGQVTLFCHATPRSDNELVTRNTPEDRLAPLVKEWGADLIVCGHTHMQFLRRIEGIEMVNAGSVGMPFGKTGADWALIADGRVELRTTSYDLEAAGERIRRADYPLVVDLENPPDATEMETLFESRALEGR